MNLTEEGYPTKLKPKGKKVAAKDKIGPDGDKALKGGFRLRKVAAKTWIVDLKKSPTSVLATYSKKQNGVSPGVKKKAAAVATAACAAAAAAAIPTTFKTAGSSSAPKIRVSIRPAGRKGSLAAAPVASTTTVVSSFPSNPPAGPPPPPPPSPPP